MSAKSISGILINHISGDSTAERVGLKEGDIILKYDGLYPNGDFSYLKGLCERRKDSANVELVILRNGSIEIIYVGGGELGINGTSLETKISPKDIEASVAPSKDSNQYFESGADYQFRTLLTYGKVISGLGWVTVILGVIGILAGLGYGDEGIVIAGASFFGVLAGIGMVASGQLISCFVAIEKNTRATYEILKEKV